MPTIKSRPNPHKASPTLAHLRRVAEDALIGDIPKPEPGRYEKDLARFMKNLPDWAYLNSKGNTPEKE